MEHEQVKLDTLALTVTPIHLGGPEHDMPEGTEYTLFDLRMHINGIDILAPDAEAEELKAIDDSQLWLAQRYNRGSWLLTCTCGTPECAGFHRPVATRRQGGRLTWTFPSSYFDHLRSRGLVSSRRGPSTFVFDAQQVYEQFEAANNVVRDYEKQAGKPSGFTAGSGHGAPYYALDKQYAQAEAWYLKRNKHRRYARHTGTQAGICAGAPSIGRTWDVK
jgi:hypothetical protein